MAVVTSSNKLENFLAVPVQVDFLLVMESNPPLSGPRIDFSRLPYKDGHLDKNSEFAYLSEEFHSKPFDNKHFVPTPGLHIHWTVPDSYTKGKQTGKANNKHIHHYNLPDRWIVRRIHDDGTEKCWMVESNYLHPEGTDNSYNAIAYPIERNDNGQPYRYMGRSYLFYSTNQNETTSIPSEIAAPEYLQGISVIGYGDPAFAAFYPNCHSVFGFCDKEMMYSNQLAAVHYEIIGWYSDRKLDPLTDPVVDKYRNFYFDGEQSWVNIQANSLTSRNCFTIEVTLFPTNKNDHKYRSVFGGSLPGIPELRIYKNRICVGFGDGNFCQTDPLLTRNAWNDIAIVFDRPKLVIYCNGEVVYTNNLFWDNLSYLQGLEAIGRGNDHSNYFTGYIKKFCLWNIARNAVAIKQERNGAAPSISEELALYFDFDESNPAAYFKRNTMLLDLSGKKQFGKLIGFDLQPVYEDIIHYSSALSFDGIDDYVELPSLALNYFTLECWIKPQRDPLNKVSTIIRKGSDDFFLTLSNDGILNFRFRIKNFSGFDGHDSQPKNIKWDEWNLICIQNMGWGSFLYVNGKLISSGSNAGELAIGDKPIYIGIKSPGDKSSAFCGKIGRIRIWTGAKHQYLSNEELVTPSQDLIACYEFNQGLPEDDNIGRDQLIDSSGNHNNGSLVNFDLKGEDSNWVNGPQDATYLKTRFKKNFNFNVFIDPKSADNLGEYPLSTLCYGSLHFDKINRPDTPTVGKVVVGSSGNEAISTWLSDAISGSQNNDITKNLVALKNISQHNNKIESIDALNETIHEDSFTPASGGHFWKLNIETNGQQADNIPEFEMPESFAFLINDLNILQQTADRKKDELKSLKRQLYADWYKYMLAKNDSNRTGEIPNPEDIRSFIENNQLTAIDLKKKKTKELNRQLNDKLGQVNLLMDQFNGGMRFEEHEIRTDDLSSHSINKVPFLKLIRDIRFNESTDQHIVKDTVLGLMVRNSEDRDMAWQVGENFSSDRLAAVSFWAYINSQDKQYSSESFFIAIAEAQDSVINAMGMGKQWRSIFINAKPIPPYDTPAWKHLPKDQWFHIYLETSYAGQNIRLMLMNQLKGRIASIRLFKQRLSPTEIYCDMNMLLMKRMTIGTEKAPRYWEAAEPVIMIEGEIAKASSRYGFDGELPCIYFTGNASGSPDIAHCYSAEEKNSFREMILARKSIASLLNEIGKKFPVFSETVKSSPASVRPWYPLFLEWQVGIASLVKEITDEQKNSSTDFIQKNYEFDIATRNLSIRKNISPKFEPLKTISGTSILTPGSKFHLLTSIEKYLEQLPLKDDAWKEFDSHSQITRNPFVDDNGKANSKTIKEKAFSLPWGKNDSISIALYAYNELSRTHFLSQTLNGFNAALQMLHHTYQLPVADPLGSESEQKFTALIKDYIGRETKWAPSSEYGFDGLRTGALKVLALNIIDSFGQVRSIGPGNIRYTNSFAGGNMPPRIAQAAQVNFRWLSGNEENMEMNDHPASSPICGWLLPNFIDESIMIYNQDGTEIGEIGTHNNKITGWHSVPGSGDPITVEQIPNIYLRDVVKKLMNVPAIGNFIDLVEKTIDGIEPDNSLLHSDLHMLFGKPIAIVRAMVDLEIKGNPSVDQSWNAIGTDMEQARQMRGRMITPRKTNSVEKIRMPVWIGQFKFLHDGVVGYWIDGPDKHFQTVIPVGEPDFEGLIGDHTISQYYDTANAPLKLSSSGGPVTMTLLVDPRGKMHAISGILPMKAIDIPDKQFRGALKNMSFSFFCRPLLMPAGTVAIPLPEEPGYHWYWLTQENKTWKRVSTTGIVDKSTFKSSFKEGEKIWAELVTRGWIEEITTTTAKVALINHRKNPLPGELLSVQLSKIEQLLAAGHINDVKLFPDFTITNQVVEGWLKLNPDNY